MSYQLDAILENADRHSIDADEFAQRVRRLMQTDASRLRRLWNYYRNPMLPAPAPSVDAGSERPYRQAQEWGLPPRITGVSVASFDSDLPSAASTSSLDEIARKEVVVENDIGWRVDTMVDFLFGKAPSITASTTDVQRGQMISRLLLAILENNGGVVFLQQLALMGAVYGFVDVLVKFDAGRLETSSPSSTRDSKDAPILPNAGPAPRSDASSADSAPATTAHSPNELSRIARCIRLEIVEPTRALPLLNPRDYRDIHAYAQVYTMPRSIEPGRHRPRRKPTSWLDRVFPRLKNSVETNEQPVTVVELVSAARWQRYEDESLVAQGANSLGELPLVHIQNSAMPFEYAGGSDVEQLLALQDELNTRLSDRAHRITMQSFKMYLGRGIDNFGELPVAPGRMWMTENENATIQEFGGDANSPSEDAHVREIREAMDKTSSVTPIAAGAIKGRIGRLTSAAALRVTLLALLAKTERKRTLYGDGLKQMFELSLAWLDRSGLFTTTADERQVALSWPSALPIDDAERLADAHSKINLGVPRETVLRELGYAAS